MNALLKQYIWTKTLDHDSILYTTTTHTHTKKTTINDLIMWKVCVEKKTTEKNTVNIHFYCHDWILSTICVMRTVAIKKKKKMKERMEKRVCKCHDFVMNAVSMVIIWIEIAINFSSNKFQIEPEICHIAASNTFVFTADKVRYALLKVRFGCACVGVYVWLFHILLFSHYMRTRSKVNRKKKKIKIKCTRTKLPHIDIGEIDAQA